MSEPLLPTAVTSRRQPRHRALLPSARPYNVLFLCDDNAGRSLMAEALLRHWGSQRFRAYSAGLRPAAAPHALALEAIASARLPTAELRPKSWTEFAMNGAPSMDFVLSVSAVVAAEPSPAWPGKPLLAHWGIGDPASARGQKGDLLRAFQRAYREIEGRIKLFVSLPVASLDRLTLSNELRRME